MSEAIPVFCARVKLPSFSDYALCPNGDTKFVSDYRKALSHATPPGFKAARERGNERWAKDSEGYTLVPLRLVDKKASLAYWIARCDELQRKIDTMKAVAKTLSE